MKPQDVIVIATIIGVLSTILVVNKRNPQLKNGSSMTTNNQMVDYKYNGMTNRFIIPHRIKSLTLTANSIKL